MKLGFIGIGLMGRPMTLRLLAAGYQVTVWNRSPDKLAPVLAKGARPAASPAEVARAAETVMMCVTDQRAAEQVLFGPQGVLEGAEAAGLVVDFSSIAPASAREFAARLEKRGMGLIDAPVSGGVAGAEQGTPGGDASCPALHAHGRFRGRADDQALQPGHHRIADCRDRGGDLPCGSGRRGRVEASGSAARRLRRLAAAADFRRTHGGAALRAIAGLRGDHAEGPGERRGGREGKTVPLPMASTAVQLYRMLAAQGKIDQEISTLIELLAGERT